MEELLFPACGMTGLLALLVYHAQRRVGVKQKLSVAAAPICSDPGLSCILYASSAVQTASKMYETGGTGFSCSSEKPEKSTAIQVNLFHQFARIQCAHHPPRARRL